MTLLYTTTHISIISSFSLLSLKRAPPNGDGRKTFFCESDSFFVKKKESYV